MFVKQYFTDISSLALERNLREQSEHGWWHDMYFFEDTVNVLYSILSPLLNVMSNYYWRETYNNRATILRCARVKWTDTLDYNCMYWTCIVCCMEKLLLWRWASFFMWLAWMWEKVCSFWWTYKAQQNTYWYFIADVYLIVHVWT